MKKKRFGNPEAGTRRIAAAANKNNLRDEFTQIIISVLNEKDPGTDKAKKYVMIDRLVKLACGMEFTIGKTKHHYPPDRAAIKEILDRLIGKPKQDIGIDEDSGKITIVIDDPNDRNL